MLYAIASVLAALVPLSFSSVLETSSQEAATALAIELQVSNITKAELSLGSRSILQLGLLRSSVRDRRVEKTRLVVFTRYPIGR